MSEKIVLIPDTLQGILASKLAKGADESEVRTASDGKTNQHLPEKPSSEQRADRTLRARSHFLEQRKTFRRRRSERRDEIQEGTGPVQLHAGRFGADQYGRICRRQDRGSE